LAKGGPPPRFAIVASVADDSGNQCRVTYPAASSRESICSTMRRRLADWESLATHSDSRRPESPPAKRRRGFRSVVHRTTTPLIVIRMSRGMPQCGAQVKQILDRQRTEPITLGQ